MYRDEEWRGREEKGVQNEEKYVQSSSTYHHLLLLNKNQTLIHYISIAVGILGYQQWRRMVGGGNNRNCWSKKKTNIWIPSYSQPATSFSLLSFVALSRFHSNIPTTEPNNLSTGKPILLKIISMEIVITWSYVVGRTFFSSYTSCDKTNFFPPLYSIYKTMVYTLLSPTLNSQCWICHRVWDCSLSLLDI